MKSAWILFLAASTIVPTFLQSGCTGDPSSDVTDDVIGTGRDHTLPSFATTADFLDFAGDKSDPAQIKFIIADFQGSGRMHYEEPLFFAMHDEWSWFSLLNDIAIPGYDFEPIAGYSFDSVAEIFSWAGTMDDLPLDLIFVSEGSRLYSPRFYDRAFNKVDNKGKSVPRFFGCGSVLHFPPDPARPVPGETWAFELEYTDLPSVADVERFFEILSRTLPEGVGERLVWIVRSASQETVARRIDQAGGPYAGRWATWESFQIPGDWQTYNPGIAAGIVKMVPDGGIALSGGTENVAVLGEIPDDIPPVAAIVTAVPQTPLSHIGILARARGTPNLYVAGVDRDQRFITWDSYRKPVIVKAMPDAFSFTEMTGAQWTFYKALVSPRKVTIKPVDVAGMAETFDPLTTDTSWMRDLVPAIGGKTAGFIILKDYPGLDLPDQPLGLTVRGYREFIDTLDPSPAEIVAQSAWSDSRVRLVVTEGPDAYLQAAGGTDSARNWLDALRTVHSGDPIGRAIDAGGIRAMMMAAPMDPGYVSRVTTALSKRFSFLSPAQGLRFRSSSSAEDVEGFNGAGLYESHTGYLNPELQPPQRQTKTVADAIRRVWASYWLYGAVEERELAGIDHLAANMGILVHPVFDDDHEAANGVLTLEVVRHPDGDKVTMTVNMQYGALSVTNPPAGSNALPEVDVVTRTGDAMPVIERVRPSTEVEPGIFLLSDAELTELLDILSKMAFDWLVLRNEGLKTAQFRTTLTVDSEIKRMSAGWPSRLDGTTPPERLVIKQARTIERPVTAPESVLTMPVPRDLLAFAARIEKQTCVTTALQVEIHEVFTDSSAPWPFDFDSSPFDAFATVRIPTAIPGFDFADGDWFILTHLQASFERKAGSEGFGVLITPLDPATAGFNSLSIDQSGEWSISGADGASASGGGAACTMTIELTSPQAFLESLLK
ncbi:hypothetical protein KBA39_02045 [Myxococcota bacterium]|nr:hypothetical protein [Myxococcota bacterium]HOD07629.1 PEP/pyruvate-binding domain-containing protein [Myxococcota bacterium]